MVTRTTIAGITVLMINTGSAYSGAGPFDGTWVGAAPEARDCGVLSVTLVIGENKITGTVSGKHGSPRITSGAVGPNGTAQVTYAPNLGFSGTVQFSGDRFTGTFGSVCGARSVSGRKV